MADLISRPFYCPNHKIHDKATHYVVWGGTRQKLILYKIEWNVKNGMTPHLIVWKGLVKENKFMSINISCGVLGCGVSLKKEEDDSYTPVFNKIQSTELPLKEWNALVMFRNTNYELS
jgi:hypothetical protein